MRMFWVLLGLAAVSAADALSCITDDCLRAVVRAEATASTRRNGTADCAAFLRGTITPATSTEYHTVSVTGTLNATRNTTVTRATQTAATGASLLDRGVDRLPWERWASQHNVVDQLRKRQSTSGSAQFPTKTPSYAATCSSAAAYTSACSCLGVNSTIVTASAPTTTVTVVRTFFRTSTHVRTYHAANATTHVLSSGAARSTGLGRVNGTVGNAAGRHGTLLSAPTNGKINATAVGSTGNDSTRANTAAKASHRPSSKAPHRVEDAMPTSRPNMTMFSNSTATNLSNITAQALPTANSSAVLVNGTSPNNGSLSDWAAKLVNATLAASARLDANSTRAPTNRTALRAPFPLLNSTGTATAIFANTTGRPRCGGHHNGTRPTATIDKTCGETSTPFKVRAAQDGGKLKDWFLRFSGNSLLFTGQEARSSLFAVGRSGRLCAVGVAGRAGNAAVALVENKTDTAASALWFVDGALVANMTGRGYAEVRCLAGGGSLSCTHAGGSTHGWLGCGLQLALAGDGQAELGGIACSAVQLLVLPQAANATRPGANATAAAAGITRPPAPVASVSALVTAAPVKRDRRQHEEL